MIWLQFAGTARVIVPAGVRLARYGDVLGEKSGLGRSWIGVVLLAATTSLPELFTALAPPHSRRYPTRTRGRAGQLHVQPGDLVDDGCHSARAAERARTQGHAISIGFGLLLTGIAGVWLIVDERVLSIGWVGVYTPVLVAVYFVAMRVIFSHEQHRRACEAQEVAEERINTFVYGNTSTHICVA